MYKVFGGTGEMENTAALGPAHCMDEDKYIPRSQNDGNLQDHGCGCQYVTLRNSRLVMQRLSLFWIGIRETTKG
jgi:hypothetical protein